MKWNEDAAIRFLQAALQTEPRAAKLLPESPNGITDAGWCCTEHALVASVAFACLGEPAFKCSGEAMIINHKLRTKWTINPHEFIIIDRDRPRVFDSSLQSPENGVSGVVTDFEKHSPEKRLHVFTEETVNKIPQKISEQPNGIDLVFFIAKRELPNAESVNRISDNPIGRWLTNQFEAQEWSKIIWETMRLLRSDETALFGSRDEIWTWLHGLPSRDKEIKKLLEKAKK